MPNKGNIVVLSAASGAGKSTILTALQQKMPELTYSLSATTRAPRGTEKDGVEYHFLSREVFEKLVREGGFVEWAEVHGNLYGTPRAPIDALLSQGKTILMDIDVQGKVALDKLYPHAHGVYIEAPSWEELERRLRSRGTDSEEAIALRLANAHKENEFARFAGKYEYYIVNDDLDETVAKIERLIYHIENQQE